MRPTARPGLHLLRRDARSQQLGLEWPGAAAVADTPAVQAVLAAVDGFRDLRGVVQAAAQAPGVTEQLAAEAAGTLLDAGALVDSDAVAARVGGSDETWAAWWLLAGARSTAQVIASARAATQVWVHGEGPMVDLIRRLLVAEQVPLAAGASTATAQVLVSAGEPSRGEADDAMRRGTPYLVVGRRELVGLVGPFVVPGRTACLRCVDMSQAARDRCWHTLVESAATSPPGIRAEPPALLATIAGYAASEIAIWASGGLPVSCDHVVEIPYGLGEIATVAYETHPECGCGWDVGRETMTA